jgi:hypothetical protein
MAAELDDWPRRIAELLGADATFDVFIIIIGRRRVATDDQPLAGIVRTVDLGHVALIRIRLGGMATKAASVIDESDVGSREFTMRLAWE